ncbi:MAG: FapA family protein [Spirochaetes bacterium]|nr:FapA family protein [Spirochaetota bacterium]
MDRAVAVGKLEILVDEGGFLASLVFTPDRSGAEWNTEKIGRYLLDNRLSGVTPARLNGIIRSFASGSGRVVEVLARGVPAQAPRPEEAEWSALEVPPEAEAVRIAALSSSPPPRLERIRVEKVAVERIVRKPSAFPFLQQKEEKVVEYVKREIREPSALDPSVLRVGYARKGERLGILGAPRPGKPGRTIFGKAIPAESLDEALFALGDGLAREGNALTAQVAGFVRIGRQWADMVPFAFHAWEVRLSANGGTVLVDFSPGNPRLPPPDAPAIHAKAVELSAEKDLHVLSEPEIAALLAEAVRTGTALSGRSLSPDMAGTVETAVAENRMRATMSLRKARGHGAWVDIKAIGAAVGALKLKPLDADRIRKDINAFLASDQLDLVDYVLSEGVPPEPGKDRTIAWSAAFLPPEDAAKIMKKLADFPGAKDLLPSLEVWPLSDGTKVAFVASTQEFGKLSSPVPGRNGRDVFGTEVPAQKGKEPVIMAYENVGQVVESVKSSADGVLFYGFSGGIHRLRVAPHRDAVIEPSASPDSMSASVSIKPGSGFGDPATVEGVLRDLKSVGIVHGIDEAAVANAVMSANAGNPVPGAVVASGKQPVPAGGVRIEWIMKTASGAAVTLRPDGSADFRNQDRFTDAPSGAPILDLVPSGGKGEDGRDVFGRVLKPDRDPAIVPLPSWNESIRSEALPDGRTRLFAAIAGELRFDKNSVAVILLHGIKGDVGPKSGNVRFSGAVKVGGSVLSGYCVYSGGDVQIDGSVEAALVSADGAVRIAEGIKGGKRGVVRARHTIDAAFAEQARLLAVEDIRIRNACLLCDVKTNGHLNLSGERGALIGGTVRAKKGVDVHALGSENGVRTLVSFGQDFLLVDQIEGEEREIEKLKTLMIQTERRMTELESTGKGLAAVRSDKLKILKLIEKRTFRLFNMREKLEEHFPSEIRVRGTVYQGVILESHGRTLEIVGSRHKVVFIFDPHNGHIQEKPLT